MGTYGNHVQYMMHIPGIDDRTCSFEGCEEDETVTHIVIDCSAFASTHLHRLVSTTGYFSDFSTWMGCNTQLSIETNSQIIGLLEEFLLQREHLLRQPM